MYVFHLCGISPNTMYVVKHTSQCSGTCCNLEQEGSCITESEPVFSKPHKRFPKDLNCYPFELLKQQNRSRLWHLMQLLFKGFQTYLPIFHHGTSVWSTPQKGKFFFFHWVCFFKPQKDVIDNVFNNKIKQDKNVPLSQAKGHRISAELQHAEPLPVQIAYGSSPSKMHGSAAPCDERR